ncbi:hypothetical protein QAD02_018156 [Eretmocerus hayati]|uniref:Uncharacterized protein n=1 Tax=Eretmocerus hayati TaxID=131215 RepID=A0ACC2PGC8_9HYME|nr:hypothetical protein QAD02_018156 [Eretmocerus hayati]
MLTESISTPNTSQSMESWSHISSEDFRKEATREVNINHQNGVFNAIPGTSNMSEVEVNLSQPNASQENGVQKVSSQLELSQNKLSDISSSPSDSTQLASLDSNILPMDLTTRKDSAMLELETRKEMHDTNIPSHVTFDFTQTKSTPTIPTTIEKRTCMSPLTSASAYSPNPISSTTQPATTSQLKSAHQKVSQILSPQIKVTQASTSRSNTISVPKCKAKSKIIVKRKNQVVRKGMKSKDKTIFELRQKLNNSLANSSTEFPGSLLFPFNLKL